MIASPSLDATTTDRRVSPRLQPAYRTICKLNHPGVAGHPAIGLVWNVSETGVSMLMADPPQPGVEVTAELAPESGGPGLRVLLRVMHVRPVSTGDYFMGARFGTPLSAHVMKSFLVMPPSEMAGGNGELPKGWSPPKKG